jgi:hypothetical protein
MAKEKLEGKKPADTPVQEKREMQGSATYKPEERPLMGTDTRKLIPACDEFAIPERYTQRINDIDSTVGSNDQVEIPKVWEHGRLKKIREVQLGDPTKSIGAAGNGYLGN